MQPLALQPLTLGSRLRAPCIAQCARAGQRGGYSCGQPCVWCCVLAAPNTQKMSKLLIGVCGASSCVDCHVCAVRGVRGGAPRAAPCAVRRPRRALYDTERGAIYTRSGAL